MEEPHNRNKTIFTGKALAALVIPLVLEQMLGITVGMADSIMVSSAGEAAVSGVSLVDSIAILLINAFASLSTGGAVVAAHRLGEKNEEEAVKCANQLLLLVTGIAVTIMAFAVLSNRWLLKAIFGSVEDAVMKNAVAYFYITAVSYPFLGIYNASAALSRAMGDSRTTMRISIWMNVLNIVGIAMITVVGQALGADEKEQAKAYIKKLMGYAYLFMVILNSAIILLAPRIAGLYQVSEDVLLLAGKVIVFHSFCAMLFWPTGFALPNALRAAMDANFTMWVSIGCMWVFRIGCSYLFVKGFSMGLMGIWAVMAVDWVVRSVFFIWRIKSGKWLKKGVEGKC